MWFIWDAEPDGNVQHIAEHGVTPAECEQAMARPIDTQRSRTTGRPIAFGYTQAGRKLAVVYVVVGEPDVVYVLTAYEVE